MSPASLALRGIFGVLAAVDTVLLAWLVVNYGWTNLHVAANIESPAAILIYPLLWVLSVGEKLFFAAFFAAVGAGIVREFTARRDPARWRAVLASIVLLFALAAIVLVWTRIASNVFATGEGFLDRLTFFDGLAKRSDGRSAMFGFSEYSAGSIGAFLATMLVAAYLAEKYLLSWWRVRWPVPLLPLLAIAWVAWNVHAGEQAQRAWVAAQQWRPIAAEQTWIDALGTCEALGPEWRLPRRAELSLLLATRPAAIAGWQGAAWTSSAAEGGSRAIAVDLKPRKSGRWNKSSEPLRDESPCELRDMRGYAGDRVEDLRPRVCAETAQSPVLYTPGLRFTALRRGNVQFEQPQNATICIAPGAGSDSPPPFGRGYPGEREFVRVADFTRYMEQTCRKSPTADAVACFAFAPDRPNFEEDDDEVTLRRFCDLARNGEGCSRYAALMDRHPGYADRANRYRELACTRGYRPACAQK